MNHADPRCYFHGGGVNVVQLPLSRWPQLGMSARVAKMAACKHPCISAQMEYITSNSGGDPLLQERVKPTLRPTHSCWRSIPKWNWPVLTAGSFTCSVVSRIHLYSACASM